VRSSNDEKLAGRSQQGDQSAERELVARYSFLVATIISREGFFSQTGTRDDLMQYGYIGLLRAIRTYRSGMGAAFKTYASTCVRNEIVSALRAEKSKKHGALTTASSLDDEMNRENETALLATREPTPEERLLAADYSRQLTTFMKTKLTEREREVLKRHARGYSYSEIALQLSTTPKAVDGAIQRVRKKMAQGS